MKVISIILALCFSVTSALRAQTTGVRVDLVLDQDQFLPDEDLVIGVRVSNQSGQTLTFGKESDWVSFSIQRENNYLVERTGEVPVVGEFTLQTAQAGTPRFNLTPYFSFQKPGRYRVTATVKLPQWGRQVSSAPKSFTVMTGVPLANVPAIEFGVPPPPGTTNATPEIRRYMLQKATYLKQLTLYCQVSDAAGKTIRVFPIGPVVSFAQPEAVLDRASNLHVLHQFGARAFNYCVISPDGKMLGRRVYDYTGSRPTLRPDEEGHVYVIGGSQRFTQADVPVAARPTPPQDAKKP